MLEIIAHVIDFLAVPDLLRFARVSKRAREMVYEDWRWVQKLRLMDCWNEIEARKRSESSIRPLSDGTARTAAEERAGIGVNATGNGDIHDSTRYDTAQRLQTATLDQGFKNITLPRAGTQEQRGPEGKDTMLSALHVLFQVRSVRGKARQEYGKVYQSLAPFYKDAISCTIHTNAVVFQRYRDPDQQAQMLSNLDRFGRSDTSLGWQQRESKLDEIKEAFEYAVTRELEHGLEIDDFDGKVRKYCYVLTSLGRGEKAVQIPLSRSKSIGGGADFGDPVDFLRYDGAGGASSQPTFQFFGRLSVACNDQLAIFQRILPPEVGFVGLFLRRIEGIISEYLTSLFIHARGARIELYLKAVSMTYGQCLAFGDSIKHEIDPSEEMPRAIEDMVFRIFHPHSKPYLDEEYAFFKLKSDKDVGDWEKKLSDQDENMRTMYMANVNRQADKRDFLSSFKKVVMMPVNVLPSFPSVSPFGAKSATAKALVNGDTRATTQPGKQVLHIPGPNSTNTTPDISRAPSPLPIAEPPTTELAAKAAIMTTRLQGIRSLFSIEVALELVHTAKNSIDRAAVFVTPDGPFEATARRQCLLIFVLLLQTLGTRHIKAGFDQAVEHLTNYNPRETANHKSNTVTPLMTFLELVNVGDLIQQMLDVFYEQELIATRLAQRDDLLDPATKEKKRFEAMLDERVAAGLNKGIEVLISEVEYLCATTQKPEDYNPESVTEPESFTAPDPTQPSATARQIIACISSHTSLLSTSTDAPLLDVFNQEVGLRLFTTLCKHLKRQRISTSGAVTLIADTTLYYNFICTSLARKKSQAELRRYFESLRELSMLYLVDVEGRGKDGGKELAALMADQGGRWRGVWRAEEVLEFVERRADWLVIRGKVERAMFGQGCEVM